MATIRKKAGKWQGLIRRSFHKPISKTFISKQDAHRWARETQRLIEVGVPTKSSEDIIFYIQKYFFSTNFQSSSLVQPWFDGLVGMSGVLFNRFVPI